MRGNRRPDICAENNRNRLHKRQKTRVDEADNHDGARARRLDDRRDGCAGKDSDKAVCGEEAQDRSHFVSGNVMEAVAHQFHPENENRQAAEDLKK